MIKKKAAFLMAIFATVGLAISGKVLYLQTVKKDFLLEKAERQRATPITIDAKRGDILASDGTVLATSVPTYTVYSDNRYIKDIDEAASFVATFFDLNYDEVKAKIESNYYVELVKQVSKDKIDEFNKTRPKGIAAYETTTRIYPNNTLLSNVLGFLGSDQEGLAGLELKLEGYGISGVDGVDTSERDKNGNTIVRNPKDILNPTDGNDAILTIDYDIQYHMEKVIKQAVEEEQAVAGLAISINPSDGSILGIAQYPSYDPNNYKDYDSSLYKSMAHSAAYESGSTFKPITVAIADATSSVDIENDVFYDNGSWYIGKHRIGNWANKAFGALTAREVLMNSSNVGTVQIAAKIPPEEFNEYIKKLGLADKTGIELPGETNSILFTEEQLKSPINLATSSFGQGMAVTPIQLMKAWSIVINGGHDINPHILKEVVSPSEELVYSSDVKTSNLEQIIPESTSLKVRDMLKSVVDSGTGRKARIEGYEVGGKTATAQIAENGVYRSDKYRVSFMGFAPVSNPQVLTYVLLDSPANSAATGGDMCARPTKKILEYALEKLGIEPTDGSVSDNETAKNYEINDYKYKNKDYLINNPPSISYEFQGDGDLIIDQSYSSADGVPKVIFSTTNIFNDGYVTVPDLLGYDVREVLTLFGDYPDILTINGNKNGKVVIQDTKAGSQVNISNGKIVLWAE